MWVFTTERFFSVVENAQDRARVIVRARNKEHIENLLKVMNWRCEIHHLETADYPARIILKKEEWAWYLTGAALEIDYTNFKDRVTAPEAWGENQHTAMLALWQAIYRALDERRGDDLDGQLALDFALEDEEPWDPADYFPPDDEEEARDPGHPGPVHVEDLLKPGMW